MNFTPLQWTRLSPVPQAGTRIGPSARNSVQPTTGSTQGGASPVGEVGTIPGVLSAEENLAVARIFESAPHQVYGFDGSTRQTPMPTGQQLDLLA